MVHIPWESCASPQRWPNGVIDSNSISPPAEHCLIRSPGCVQVCAFEVLQLPKLWSNWRIMTLCWSLQRVQCCVFWPEDVQLVDWIMTHSAYACPSSGRREVSVSSHTEHSLVSSPASVHVGFCVVVQSRNKWLVFGISSLTTALHASQVIVWIPLTKQVADTIICLAP